MAAMKRCSTCRKRKPTTDFHKRSAAIDGRQAKCKVCNSLTTRVQLWNRSGIEGMTHARYNEMLAKQDGRCAICAIKPTLDMYDLSVDHDHETKAVRKLLCGKCNAGLGMFDHDPELLAGAIEYLNDHKKP
jgi:hypothetical protein